MRRPIHIWVYGYFYLILLIKNTGHCVLIKSDPYCLNTRSNIQEYIRLQCPMSTKAVVNVFELRFMLNSTCSMNSLHQAPKCLPKSIRGSNLLMCDGDVCSLGQIKSIKVCGVEANQIYALYECIPVVIDKSIIWSRESDSINDTFQNDNQLATMKHLKCPADTTIVITKALATMTLPSSQNDIPTCSLQEPFTIQSARSCCSSCSSCNVSMNAPGFRCKQKVTKNLYTTVNFSCIPRMEEFSQIRKYVLCETNKIETNTASSGFIVSSNYPNPYPNNRKCNITLESNSPLYLYLLEFDIVYPHSLLVKTPLKTLQLHAKDKLPRRIVENSTSVVLQFDTNYITSKGPVRIYFTNISPLTEHFTEKSIRQNEPRENHLYAFGTIEFSQAALIYGLSAATLVLLLSSVGLLIATFVCPRSSNFDIEQQKRNNKSVPNSRNHLIPDYGQYEELTNPLLFTLSSPLPNRRCCMHFCRHCGASVNYNQIYSPDHIFEDNQQQAPPDTLIRI